jgi:hypothetical protein
MGDNSYNEIERWDVHGPSENRKIHCRMQKKGKSDSDAIGGKTEYNR